VGAVRGALPRDGVAIAVLRVKEAMIAERLTTVDGVELTTRRPSWWPDTALTTA